jgi:hypothetical protein
VWSKSRHLEKLQKRSIELQDALKAIQRDLEITTSEMQSKQHEGAAVARLQGQAYAGSAQNYYLQLI